VEEYRIMINDKMQCAFMKFITKSEANNSFIRET